jgi:hypothetical protein
MINYKEMDVKSMSEEQMGALIGKKYSEFPVDPTNTEVINLQNSNCFYCSLCF